MVLSQLCSFSTKSEVPRHVYGKLVFRVAVHTVVAIIVTKFRAREVTALVNYPPVLVAYANLQPSYYGPNCRQADYLRCSFHLGIRDRINGRILSICFAFSDKGKEMSGRRPQTKYA